MLCLLALAGSLAAGLQAAPGDWPQWRGPAQDGVSRETGLAAKWPEKGPPELWRVPLGAGYSSVAVVAGRAYTMFADKEGEFAVVLDVVDGKSVRKTRLGPMYHNSYGDGPRATPTLDEGRVYWLGASGELLCQDAVSGRPIWRFNVLEKFAAENADYGLAASPVVMGNMLLVVVGGKNGHSLAALDKATGDVHWTSLSDKAGYATPLHVDVDGSPQIVVLTGVAVVGLAPKDGRELWRVPWKTTLDANVATPIFADNRLFVSSGYGTGCALFSLAVTGPQAAIEQLWANKRMMNYFSSSVRLGRHLYGFDNTTLVCMDFQTGAVKWRQKGFNRGSLLAADGKLVIYGERATLALADASPEKYRELAKADVLDGQTWTVPTLSGGKLFVRNTKELVCLDLRDKKG